MTADLDPRPLCRALAETPDAAAEWLKLGLTLAARGELALAIAPIRRATILAPRAPAAWEALGMAEAGLERWAEAAAAWTQAVMLRPGRAESHVRLARVLVRSGDVEAADRCYVTAGRLGADASLAGERALTWADAGQRQGRADAYRRAMALEPGLAGAWVNLGAMSWRAGSSDAAAAWGRAAALVPDLADPHNNLGTVEQRAGRLPAAARSYRRALALEPPRSDAWFNLGSALQNLGRVEAAVAGYERALALRPDFLDALVPLSVLANFLGLLDRATAFNRRILAQRPDSPEANRAILSALVFDPALDGVGMRKIREGWCAERLPAVSAPRFANDRDPDRVIRVGFLGGPNLRGNTHAFVALPGFEGLDRRAHGLEVTVYSVLRPGYETPGCASSGGQL